MTGPNSDPAASDPAASDAVPSDPAASDPAASDAAASNPTTSNPAASNPAASNPAASNPATSNPAPPRPATGAAGPGSVSYWWVAVIVGLVFALYGLGAASASTQRKDYAQARQTWPTSSATATRSAGRWTTCTRSTSGTTTS